MHLSDITSQLKLSDVSNLLFLVYPYITDAQVYEDIRQKLKIDCDASSSAERLCQYFIDLYGEEQTWCILQSVLREISRVDLAETIPIDGHPWKLHPLMVCLYKVSSNCNKEEGLDAKYYMLQCLNIKDEDRRKSSSNLDLLLMMLEARYLEPPNVLASSKEKNLAFLRQLYPDPPYKVKTLLEEYENLTTADDQFDLPPQIFSTDEKYDMCINKDLGDCGICLIFNQETFNTSSETPHSLQDIDRTGSEKDVEKLSEVFSSFGLDVFIYKNKTSIEMRDICQKYSEQDHSKTKVLVACFCSHGEQNRIMGYDFDYLSVNTILELFSRSRQLSGIPKLVFLQFCQGKTPEEVLIDEGKVKDHIIDENKIKMPSTTKEGPDAEPYLLHAGDCLLAYPSLPGTLCWREKKEEGSWFMQSLCTCLQKYGDVVDIEMVLKKVRFELNEVYSQYTHNYKEITVGQTGWGMTSLSKKLIFQKASEPASITR